MRFLTKRYVGLMAPEKFCTIFCVKTTKKKQPRKKTWCHLNLSCLTYLPTNWKRHLIIKVWVRARNCQNQWAEQKILERWAWGLGRGSFPVVSVVSPWQGGWGSLCPNEDKPCSPLEGPPPSEILQWQKLGARCDWAMRKVDVPILKLPANYSRDILPVNLLLIIQGKWFCKATHSEMIHLT